MKISNLKKSLFAMFYSLRQYRYFVLSSIHNKSISRFTYSTFSNLQIIINWRTQVNICTYILFHFILFTANLQDINQKYAQAKK